MRTRSTWFLAALLTGSCSGAEPPDPSVAVGGPLLFNATGLLAGARSDVPDDALAAYPAALGGALTRHTAITGIEFHIPGVVSSAALSPTPVPLLLEENGVSYYQVTGELSARIVDDLGVYRVVGPIDAQGVNHRREPFVAEASHPRASLPGAFFTVRWPVTGFTGAVVQNQACNDGGGTYAQAPFAWQNVDDIVLLQRGYAVVSVGVGGMVYARKHADGTETIDSNPESGSGIFWTDENWWDDEGNELWETASNRRVPNTRPAAVDAALHETALPVHTVVDLWVPDDQTGQGVWVQDEYLTNPYFDWAIGQGVAPEIMRDAVVVFKNLLTQATGVRDLWTVYVGWSGSGNPAFQLASGKQNNALVLAPRALGSPPGAGNFNVWRDPSSGRRFDAFVVYAGAMPWPWFSDDNDLEAAASSVDVDPEYPIQAPYVFLHGDGDVVLSPTLPIMELNALARAWPGSRMAAQRLGDHVSLLSLERTAHGARDQLISNYDRGPFTGALWWDPATNEMNTDRVGARSTNEYARMFFQNGGDLAGFTWWFHGVPRTTPLYLALFDRLRAGGPMPVSRVDAEVFDHLAEIDETTEVPSYPDPCEGSDLPWWMKDSCLDGINVDTSAFHEPLGPHRLAAIRELAASSLLPRTTAPLVLPDVAAPEGYFLFYGATQLVRPFTDAELTLRFGSHKGYVAAFRAATDVLVAQGLWDKKLGATYVKDARLSPVLATGHGPRAPRVRPERAHGASAPYKGARGR